LNQKKKKTNRPQKRKIRKNSKKFDKQTKSGATKKKKKNMQRKKEINLHFLLACSSFNFSKGLLAMETTLVGVIKVDPKEWLGIRTLFTFFSVIFS